MILKRQYNLALGGPSSTFSALPESRISNRNTAGNRNRHNSLFIKDINFSTRNKTGGSPDYVAFLLSCRRSSNIQLLTSNLCNFLIATPPIRNDPNPFDVNKTCRSNRNKMRGSATTIWLGLSKRKSRKKDDEPSGGHESQITGHESRFTSHNSRATNHSSYRRLASRPRTAITFCKSFQTSPFAFGLRSR